MAIIEPQKEPRSFLLPLLAGGVLILALSGIGYMIYSMISGPTHKLVKLSAADAKKAAVGGNNAGPVPAGPPFPAMAALEQGSDPGGTMITLDLKNVTAAEAVEAISKQAGVKIPVRPGAGIEFYQPARYRIDLICR